MTEPKKTPRKIRHLPDPNFVSTTVDQWGGTLVECRDLWDGYSLDDAVLDSTPLKKCRWPTLFAYMHRRFGPPHIGGDDYKDLSASWMLTTPDCEVFVRVNPSLSGPGFSFSPYLVMPRDATKRAHRASELNLPADRVVAVRKAYRTTLLDLLRPVCVRDHHINALGQLGDSALDQALVECDDDDESNAYELRFHPSCGYAMPLGLFGGNEWPILCSLIRHLGDGDLEAGRVKALQVLQRDVYAEAAGAGWQVHRLMLLGARNQREAVAAGLGLGADDVARFDDELRALYDRENPNRSIVDEMTDAAVDSASDFLHRLGLLDAELDETVRGMRRDKAVSEAWAELVVIANDTFPDDVALPAEPYSMDGELPVQLKAALNGIGRTDLADWVDKTVARPQGLQALADITFHLSSQAREHQDDKAAGLTA
ncbi:hypothetical protein [Burkholderia cenocepacia]|uniref:hypothetical protein n=1 Tax=Burkholderia cenocepacia TaxID=95486 RepID=UPI002876053E|nr:hypothetical protein [Burkholderia cenocepacia]MDS0805192.1 hypothetical protein [Burkholderia cenocepacia]